MNDFQQASLEIRDEFKAGEHVVFGAHVDENLGDRVQIVVLGATDLEAGMKVYECNLTPQNLLIATACAGLLMVLMGLLRMGNLIRLVPISIVTGFTSGIAVLIALSQIKAF
ncbi:MAG: hypothetical protein EBZ22_04525, partial [Flavobacteriia bacterium]|nr:hypothetical protein [Flavobacteriia bacterium]